MNTAETASQLDLLRIMHLIRETETRLSQLFADGEVPGFIHLSIGQEAVATGVISQLERGDTLASNHRGHGHAIAKGIDLDRFFLEIMGKAEGICGGRGGSMHIADMSVGMLGANGIVAAGIPIAVGSALAHQVRKSGSIATVFFGDGALAEGVIHESLNLAALWHLPTLFVCENNGWSEFSPTAQQFKGDAATLAASHKIPARTVDGNDAVEVATAARDLIAEIRSGSGPRLLECKTTRVRGHFEGDPQKYRTEGDGELSPEADPITRLERRLLANGVGASIIAEAKQHAAAQVTAAVAAGRKGTTPEMTAALSDVYTHAGAQ